METDEIYYRRYPSITQESRQQMHPIQYNETPSIGSREQRAITYNNNQPSIENMQQQAGENMRQPAIENTQPLALEYKLNYCTLCTTPTYCGSLEKLQKHVERFQKALHKKIKALTG